ncbi:MAG: hypothetical protein K1060chlam4_00495 [Candidatus Anoxychlamydiales bacterium]|nr:hypothetical protein [Candidatus Anoxychlamydiales bacterium]
MTVKNISHNSSAIIHSGSHKAMVTKWKVGILGFRNTYHLVVLKGSTFAGFLSSTSAYVTDKIPKKQDLSASTFHVDIDKNEEIIKDEKGTVICSFNQKDKVNLSFTIEDPAFEKVDSISPELIKNLGEFLQKHLAGTSSSPSSSSPKTGEKKKEPKKEDKVEEKEKSAPIAKKDDTKSSEPSKGWVRPSLSNLCGRVAPLLVGFAFSATALAVSHFLSSGEI